MRLSISKSKNSISYYVIESIYKNGKRTSRTVEALGTHEEILEKTGGQDPETWAREYIRQLNQKEEEASREVIVKFSPTKQIPKGVQRTFSGGYLFLQKIYHEMGLHKICKSITNEYKFTYDLDSILSRLIYGRILFPSSKLSTYSLSKQLIEQPNFEVQHIYRALEVIAQKSDYIQSELYKQSTLVAKRNTHVLYYDCTNFFFEIEQEEGIKQYGLSKDHKPNPLVQMGLFMDANGLPLAFSINPGNTNEQTTLRPLERKILSDFKLSKFVICTDAGLASKDNRRFNNRKKRAFITTQSIKKLKSYLKNWVLDPKDWHLPDIQDKTYNIEKVQEVFENEMNEKRKIVLLNKVFYKERWINEDGIEQRLIITFSLKYLFYQRKIRDEQLKRAVKLIEKNPGKLKQANQNDYKRFILKRNLTPDGELAETDKLTINQDKVKDEQQYDGFYGVCTNLEDDIKEIIKINKRRWEIEESFRIMKSEFKSRPVFLRRDDRILAHFTTCFLALFIYRILEKRLEEKFTSNEIIDNLRQMNFFYIENEGYSPSYTRNDFTDSLHDAFSFRTDYQIINKKNMKNIIKNTK